MSRQPRTCHNSPERLGNAGSSASRMTGAPHESAGFTVSFTSMGIDRTTPLWPHPSRRLADSSWSSRAASTVRGTTVPSSTRVTPVGRKLCIRRVRSIRGSWPTGLVAGSVDR